MRFAAAWTRRCSTMSPRKSKQRMRTDLHLAFERIATMRCRSAGNYAPIAVGDIGHSFLLAGDSPPSPGEKQIGTNLE